MDGPTGKTTGSWQHEPTKIRQPGSHLTIAPMYRGSDTHKTRGVNPYGQMGLGEHTKPKGVQTVVPLSRRSSEMGDERPAKRQKHIAETRRNPSISQATAASAGRDSAPTSASLSLTDDRAIEERLRGQRKSPSNSMGHTYEGYGSRAPLPMHSPSIPPGVVAKGTVARMRDDLESKHNPGSGSPSAKMSVGDQSGVQRLRQNRLFKMKDKNGQIKRVADILGNDTLARSSMGKTTEEGLSHDFSLEARKTFSREQESFSYDLHLDVQKLFFGKHPAPDDFVQVRIVADPAKSPHLELVFVDDVYRITSSDIQWTTYDAQDLLFVCLDKSSPVLHRLQEAGKMPNVSTITPGFPGSTLSFSFKYRPFRDPMAYRHVPRLGDGRRAPPEWSNAERNWEQLHLSYHPKTNRVERGDLPRLSPNRRKTSANSLNTKSASVSPPRSLPIKYRMHKQHDSETEASIEPSKHARSGKHSELAALEFLENAKKTKPDTRQTKSRGRISIPSVDNNEVILVYPSIKGLQITKGEHERLQPGEFLNDTLIEFGLRLWMERLKIHDPQRADQIHVFSPFFYKKLKTTDPDAGYAAVRTWTSKVDIFSKRYLVVPINEKAHWYLVVVMYPGNALGTGTGDAVDQSPVLLPEQPPDGHQDDHMEIDSDQDIPGIYERPDATLSKTPRPKSVTPEGTPRAGDKESKHDDTMDISKSPTTSAHGVEEQLLGLDDTVAQEEFDELMSTEGEEEADDAWKTLQDSTYVLTFDSLGSKHPAAQKAIRNYLIQEAKHKKNIEVDPHHILGKLVKSPVQPNFCDCGLYLIKTAEKFLEKPDEFFKRIFWNKDPLTEKHPLWDVPSFSAKREALYEEIAQLSEQWKQEMGLKQSGTSQVSDVVEVIREDEAAHPSVKNVDSSDDEVEIVGETLAPKPKKKGRRSGGYGY